jgi:hypothetical protein
MTAMLRRVVLTLLLVSAVGVNVRAVVLSILKSLRRGTPARPARPHFGPPVV